MPLAGQGWVILSRIQNIREVATLNKQDIDALRELAAQIRRGCQQLINRASYDRTSIGQVTAVNGGGMYTVAAFGGTYTLPYKQSLAVGTVVRVKVPQNNWKDIYIESTE